MSCGSLWSDSIELRLSVDEYRTFGTRLAFSRTGTAPVTRCCTGFVNVASIDPLNRPLKSLLLEHLHIQNHDQLLCHGFCDFLPAFLIILYDVAATHRGFVIDFRAIC